MGGWIKLEKDLLTDPRVIRMGNQLCNGLALQGVTLAIGALAHLWMLADTHISDDDVLPLGIDEINQVVGITNFCELMPVEWLEVLDAEHVKLPNFHDHNGGTAKKNSLNSMRVTKHRKRCNAQALLDRDSDSDSDNPEKKIKKSAAPIPEDFALTPDRIEFAKRYGLNPEETLAAFRDYWTSKAKDRLKLDWDATFRTWCRSPINRPTVYGNKGTPAAPIPQGNPWAPLNAERQGMNPAFRPPLIGETPSSYKTAIEREQVNRLVKGYVPVTAANGLAHP